MKPKDRVIYPKDVMTITKKSLRYSQNLIMEIKKKRRKPRFGFITSSELADKLNVTQKIIHDLMDETDLKSKK